MAAVAEAKVKLSLEEKITAPLKRIKAQFASLSKSLGVDKITASSKKVMASIKGIGSGLAESTKRLGIFTGLLGIAGGGVVAGLMSMIRGTAEMGASLNDASKQLGMGVVNLQLWRFAAERSGMETGQFDSALANLSKKSAEAAKGNKASAATFKELGISVTDSGGKLKSNAALMEEVAAKMGKIKDHGQKQRLASMLFGGDGKEMAAMMADGMDPIKDMFAEARKGGWLIGKDVAEASSGLMDNIGNLQDRLKGVRSFISAQFIPVFNDIVVSIREWIDSNRELIQTKVVEWVKKLRGFIADLKNPTSDLRIKIDNIIESIKGWLKWLEPITGKISVFKAAAVLLGTYIAGPLILSIALVAMAFIGLGIAIMTTPIGWIMAGIAGLIAIGYALYKNWDKICGYFSGIFERICAAFHEGIIKGIMTLLYEFNPLKLIIDAIGGISEYLFGVDLTEPAGTMIKSFLLGITDTFTGVFEFFANIYSQIWEAITSGGSFSEIGMNIIKILLEGFKTGWSAVTSWMTDKIDAITKYMPNWLKDKIGLNFKFEETTKSVKETVEKSTAVVDNVKASATMRTSADLAASAAAKSTDKLDAEIMQATEVEAAKFVVPEPILLHEPQNVNVTSNITLNISVPSGSNASDIAMAVKRALRDRDNYNQRAITSALTD